MPTSSTLGPYLKQRNLNGSLSDTVYRSFEKHQTSTASRRKRPVGIAELTSLTSYYASTTERRCCMMFYDNGTYGPTNALQPGTFSVDQTELNKSYEIAKMAVRDKIKGQDWNVSTFVGELPETIKYFKDTLSTLVRTYRSVRKGDMREIRKMSRNLKKFRGSSKSATGSVSSRWLEWRYAVQPLVYDLDDALKALANRALAKPRIARSVGGHNARLRVKHAYPQYEQVSEWQVRMGCYYSVNPNVAAFKRLGLINLAETLWELTPLSFVVDWVIPVGRYVGSLDAMAGVSVLSTWQSTKARDSCTILPYRQSGGATNGGYQRSNSYSRVPGVSLALTFPPFSLSYNSSRFLDSLALTRQILIRDR